MTEIVLRESIVTWMMLLALVGYLYWLIYHNFWKK